MTVDPPERSVRRSARRSDAGGPRIGLFGQFGVGNFGNEGSLAAMLAQLRAALPDAEFVCVCPDPDYVVAAHGVAGIAVGAGGGEAQGLLGKLYARTIGRAANWATAWRETSAMDLFLIPGTGMFDDFSSGAFGVPYALFRWCQSARWTGAPVAFVSVGAAPVKSGLIKWFLRTAARAAAYRSFRDEQSREVMGSLGFDASGDPVYPDLAFMLPSPPESAAPAGDGPPRVGLGVMAYYGWGNDPNLGTEIYRAYIGKITEFALHVLDEGMELILVTGETVDAVAVDDVVANVVAARGEVVRERITAEPADGLDDVMAQLARADVVVATRFHNVVCALKIGKPTASVGYADKNAALLSAMGLGAYAQHVESFDVEVLKAQLAELLERREALSARIRETVRGFEVRLNEQGERLVARFLS